MRSADNAIAWGLDRIDRLDGPKPGGLWTARCQQFVRAAYGVPAWAESAAEAWERIPVEQRFAGGLPAFAPRGAALYYRIGAHGHVALAVGVDGRRNALSNDYMRQGRIDLAPRGFPRWGVRFLGWSYWTPFGSMEPSVRWDGEVPNIENVRKAQRDGIANQAAYRVATRLDDFGLYKASPNAKYQQGYPRKAVVALQVALGLKPTGDYGIRVHDALFGQTYGGAR